MASFAPRPERRASAEQPVALTAGTHGDTLRHRPRSRVHVPPQEARDGRRSPRS